MMVLAACSSFCLRIFVSQSMFSFSLCFIIIPPGAPVPPVPAPRPPTAPSLTVPGAPEPPPLAITFTRCGASPSITKLGSVRLSNDVVGEEQSIERRLALVLLMVVVLRVIAPDSRSSDRTLRSAVARGDLQGDRLPIVDACCSSLASRITLRLRDDEELEAISSAVKLKEDLQFAGLNSRRPRHSSLRYGRFTGGHKDTDDAAPPSSIPGTHRSSFCAIIWYDRLLLPLAAMPPVLVPVAVLLASVLPPLVGVRLTLSSVLGVVSFRCTFLFSDRGVNSSAFGRTVRGLCGWWR
uniref:Putative secreted protein n=1 Tax=Anopheles marajoara TaxID=58244 RepID=A0A2M4C6J7_9DIPT